MLNLNWDIPSVKCLFNLLSTINLRNITVDDLCFPGYVLFLVFLRSTRKNCLSSFSYVNLKVACHSLTRVMCREYEFQNNFLNSSGQ